MATGRSRPYRVIFNPEFVRNTRAVIEGIVHWDAIEFLITLELEQDPTGELGIAARSTESRGIERIGDGPLYQRQVSTNDPLLLIYEVSESTSEVIPLIVFRLAQH